MQRIADSVIEAIKSRINFVDLVSEHVKLKRAGRSFRGLCPFHSEKTPSFFVHPDKQFFYCFGCGKGGDPIKYLMLRDGLTYVEAATRLAEKVGVMIETESRPEEAAQLRDERNTMLEAHTQAAQFFSNQLNQETGAKARQYLARRKLSADTVAAFGIGYSPPTDQLASYLIKLGFAADLLAKAGLLNLYETRVTDRFRNRIMVPIKNPTGQIVGFGGRLLEAGEPKYLNSPDTPIFQKGRLLFGLTHARQTIQSENQAIMVEGYMDVIALVQAGIKNVIAPLGTAVTNEQIQLLRRYCSQVQLLFDGDAAGQRATVRTIELMVEEDFPDITVVRLPSDKDPDDMVRDSGPSGIQPYLHQAVPAVDFLLSHITSEQDLANPDTRVRCMHQLLPFVTKISGAARRSLYISRIADKLHINEAAILTELNDSKPSKSRREQRQPQHPPLYAKDPTEEFLLWLMLNNPEAVTRIFSLLSWEDFAQRFTRELARAIYLVFTREEKISYSVLEQNITAPEIMALLDRLSFPQFWGLEFSILDLDKNLNDCIQTMLIRKKRLEEGQLHSKIKASSDASQTEDDLLQARLECARARQQYLEQNGRDRCTLE